MVHTRSGAGSEPLNLPARLEAAAAAGVHCPVCLERRHISCISLTPCGHGVCVACTPRMLYEDLRQNRLPSCPVCRRRARPRYDEEFYTYMFRPLYRERALRMLQRISNQ